MPIAVEIHAVVPGVRVDPVQHHPDAQRGRAFAQASQVLVAAQDRVHVQIIGGVVAVVGPGLHDGVEVQAADAQTFQIGQLPLDPPQGAAVKVVRRVALFKSSGLPAQRLVQALVQLRRLSHGTVGRYAFSRGIVVRKSKAIGENLIHDAAPKPGGGLKVLAVDRQTEALPFLVAQSAEVGAPVPAEPAGAVRRADAEAIPQGLCRIRQSHRHGIALFRCHHGDLPAESVPVQDQVRAAGLPRLDLHPQGQHRILRQGAQGRAVADVAAVMAGGKAAVAAAAQDVDDISCAGLYGLKLLHIHAAGPQVSAAGGGHLKGAAHGKAAVIHQKAHQFRGRKGIGGRIEALVQPLQRKAAQGAVSGRGIDRGRPLKIQREDRGTLGRVQKPPPLRVSPRSTPDAVCKDGVHTAAAFVAHGEAVILRPVLPIAASKMQDHALGGRRLGRQAASAAHSIHK